MQRFVALRRARSFGVSSSRVRSVYGVGSLAAVPLVALVWVCGLCLHLMIDRTGRDPAQDIVFGPWTSGAFGPWPLLGSYELCLLLLVAGFIVTSLLLVATIVLLNKTTDRIALRIATELRAAIYRQAISLGPHELLGNRRDRPKELFADNVEELRFGLVQCWRSVPHDLVAAVLLVSLALAVNFWLTILAALLAYGGWRIVAALEQGAFAPRHDWQRRREELHDGLIDSLRLAPLVQSYSLPDPPGEPFHDRLDRAETAESRATFGDAVRGPGMALIVLLGSGFLMFVVGLPQLSVASTAFLGLVFVCVIALITRLRRVAVSLPDLESITAEIFRYLDRAPSVVEAPEADALPRLSEAIELDRVTLGNHSGGRLLDEISLTLPAGKRIAVIGIDARMPMAVASLVLRFFDPAAGRVLYDCCDISLAKLETIRGQALFVPSDGLLFAAPAVDNVTCGETGFTSFQIDDAIRQARLDDLIEELPEQLETPLDPRRLRLPGHQAFRLGLARALLRDPAVLVVEEPTSTGDDSSGKLLDEAMLSASEGRTTIVLPARPSTLRSADLVVVLHEGQVVAHGTHAELLQSSDVYRHINYVRFNPFASGQR